MSVVIWMSLWGLSVSSLLQRVFGCSQRKMHRVGWATTKVRALCTAQHTLGKVENTFFTFFYFFYKKVIKKSRKTLLFLLFCKKVKKVKKKVRKVRKSTKKYFPLFLM